MQKLAYMMLKEYNTSRPKQLKAGEWHIPFEGRINKYDLMAIIAERKDVPQVFVTEHSKAFIADLVKISTVMCARSSYTVVGVDQMPLRYGRMIELHDDMRDAYPKHMSPFEHCAPAMNKEEYDGFLPDGHPDQGWVANFRGFIQYRKMIENENIKKDSRVIAW
jgi:hypothetical protein